MKRTNLPAYLRLTPVLMGCMIIGLYACNRNTESVPDPVPQAPRGCSLTLMDIVGSPISYSYQYNYENQLVASSWFNDESRRDFEFKRDSAGRITAIIGFAPINFTDTTIIEYDAQGRWSKTLYRINSTDIPGFTVTPEYYPDGLVSKTTILRQWPDRSETEVHTFEYRNGNLGRHIRRVGNHTVTTRHEYYPDKLAPVSEVEFLSTLRGYGGSPSRNLVKRSIEQTDRQTIFQEYQYELNSQGYPTVEYTKWGGSDWVSETSYTYACN
jgi:hypothetical protein